MDMNEFFHESNYMCPNNTNYVCSANSSACQPENFFILYWLIKLVEDYAQNGVVRKVLNKD